MNRLLLKLAMSIVVASPFYSTPAAAQVAPTTKKAASVKITQGPEIEQANFYLTVVRWTTNNPGGTPEHYGVVHYGTNPKDLSQTAKSPIRLNPSHSDTVFRVRIQGLQPGTTYYYKVDSIESNGKDDGVTSEVKPSRQSSGALSLLPQFDAGNASSVSPSNRVAAHPRV